MTTVRVRAVPVGAALQLTRRALALGPERFTYAGVLELMGNWWEYGRAGWWPGETRPQRIVVPSSEHPFTWALLVLENS